MFQETKELPVTAPAKVGRYHELAEAMRRGSKLITPKHDSYGGGDPTRGCALYCLATGLNQPVGMALALGGATREYLYAQYGKETIRGIEHRFEGWCYAPQTFAELADWLDTLE